MSIITSVVVGIVIGWVVSIRSPTAGREDLIRNVAGGIIGAYIGSWLLGQMIESGSPGSFSFGIMIASSIGAAAILFVITRLNPE